MARSPYGISQRFGVSGSVLIAALALLGCGMMPGDEQSSTNSEETQEAQHFSVANMAELPPCSTKLAGSIAYSTVDAKFFSCDKKAWVEVNYTTEAQDDADTSEPDSNNPAPTPATDAPQPTPTKVSQDGGKTGSETPPANTDSSQKKLPVNIVGEFHAKTGDLQTDLLLRSENGKVQAAFSRVQMVKFSDGSTFVNSVGVMIDASQGDNASIKRDAFVHAFFFPAKKEGSQSSVIKFSGSVNSAAVYNIGAASESPSLSASLNVSGKVDEKSTIQFVLVKK
jgi:hypothetical protein